MMTRRISCVCLTLAIVGVLSAARSAAGAVPWQNDEAISLDTSSVFERQLARGEEHRYRIALTAGEYLRVIVEQSGIDVVVQTRGADGQVIADFQEEIRREGQESIELAADTSGSYTFVIKPAPAIVAPGSYAIRVASRRAATDADRSMQESRKLRTAAAQLSDEDKFAAARPLLERALVLVEGARGAEDTQVADVASQLAGVYMGLSDTARAEPLYVRALAIMDKTPGVEHPATAFVRSRLATLYSIVGQRPRAEGMAREALDVIERALGPEHLWFVRCLGTLAAFRNDAGDFKQTEELLRRQTAILEKIEYTDSVTYASALNNLGEIYLRQRDYDRAEGFLRRSLAIGEQVRGPDSWFISNPLGNLGIIALQRQDFATAAAYGRRALSIRERIAGPDNPDLSLLLNNLANIYHETGDDAQALETHFHALRIGENAFGGYHRFTLLSAANIAIIYTAAGDLPNAIAFQRRVDTIIEKQLGLNLAVGSERQKLAFVNGVSERTDRTISLHLHEAPGDPDAGALAALVLLQRKGRVLDAMTDIFAAVRQRVVDPKDQELMDRLRDATAQLARLALTAPHGADPEARQHQIKELEAQKEQLEGALSEHSAELRAHLQPVTVEAVQAALPGDAALLEFAVFRPFDPRAERMADAYGAPHYAVYIVRKDAAPRGLDLGPAAAIDAAIDALRQALRDPKRTDLRRRARVVDEQVMRPLRAFVGGATRLLISPDGELNLVPFEALVDEHGRYLIQRYAMSYLTSGRDLLRMQLPRMSRGNPVIVADPFFGEPEGVRGEEPTRQASAPLSRRSVTSGEDLSTMYFAPIAGTATEGRAIKALFPEATLLTGRRARKATLQRLDAPRMLHIASHGFFLQDIGRDPQAPAAPPVGGTRAMSASGATANPLLRSGLALAGANLTLAAHENGILTALEASSLSLWGTKLVTLSACDTGVGEIRNGEGVYGLRRAFVLAGTETLVMTLWPVSDSVTREPMAAYYAGLRAGLGRGDALRRAKLAMLKRKGRQHPFYWATFIQSGEWASLDGKR